MLLMYRTDFTNRIFLTKRIFYEGITNITSLQVMAHMQLQKKLLAPGIEPGSARPQRDILPLYDTSLRAHRNFLRIEYFGQVYF